MKYSIFSLARNALSYHENWPRAWRSPPPGPAYAVVLIGGGGHGLATAYYLAKEHGITNVAVLEKGWLGSGNIGRNTPITRSNYLLPRHNPFHGCSSTPVRSTAGRVNGGKPSSGTSISTPWCRGAACSISSTPTRSATHMRG